MAKTIKFNLICDEKPIRTIEDLQNNFSIEDVLEYYNNRLLHRWLEVRGYEKELELVNAILVEEPIEIIKELIDIFNISSDMKEIEERVYILQYFRERETLYNIYVANEFDTIQIIEDYHAGYQALIDEILENPDNIAVIKANIKEISQHYFQLFKMHHRELFWELRNNEAILAIMCLLMNDYTRDYFMPFPDGENGEILDTDYNRDKNEMYSEICNLNKRQDFLEEHLGEYLLSFAGQTDSYWKQLEDKNKKYMVINIGAGDYVRSVGCIEEEFGKGDIQDKYKILDGIDYKSNNSTRTLLYMEV